MAFESRIKNIKNQGENMVLHEKELKSILKDIKNGRKIEQQEEQVQLIQSMIIHIGSLDSELRDELIYGTFYEWILEKIF